jgi:hypothetical protein
MRPPTAPACRRILAGCARAVTLGGTALMPAVAASQGTGHELTTPLSMRLGFETVHLPEGEAMGLLGASMLFEVAPGWGFGPAVYGAASGQRGGLFVGGAELQRRWRFGERQLLAGLFAGGGGGAAAPVGGGLMLRPALTLLQDFGGWQAGLSWSNVRFPSGSIGSHQVGLAVGWDGAFRHADVRRVGEPVSDDQRSGVGVDRLLATATAYELRDGVTPERRIGLVGARFERQAEGSTWSWGVETAGAATGGAAGYMEILGSLGWAVAPLPNAAPGLRAGVRGALGLGGGGAVPTGGGLIGKAGLTLSARLSPSLSTGIEIGTLRTADTSLRAPVAQWWLAIELEPPRGAAGTLQRSEWTLSLQRYQRAQRRDGSERPLDTVGIKIDRYLGEHLYVSGQAHSAYAGGAGAYAIGLVGLGLATTPQQRGWQAGAEALAGASGGGGVDTAGGALVQALLWAGWNASASSQWRVGAGALRSVRGDLSTPVFELAWSWHFAQSAP